MAIARDPYEDLADMYDALAADPQIRKSYRHWRNLLLQFISERRLKVRTLVDLMCGTGNTTIPWTRRKGWRVIGVDSSAAMLRQARRKSRRVRWYRRDARKLRLRERADAVTCHFDALNHVLSPEEMREVFCRVAGILNPGGLFVFDVSTEHWFRWLHGRDRLSRIGKYFMTASNRYDPGNRIAEFSQLWFIPRGRLYEKRLIRVKERPYTAAEIRRFARQAGFRVLTVENTWILEGKTVRLSFVLERKKDTPRCRSGAGTS